MSSRDRDTKTLQDKFKGFFKKGGSGSHHELAITPELRRELGPETPLHRRLRAFKELGEKALHTRIQEGEVEKIWASTRDLLEDVNVEPRQAVLGLLCCIAEGQPDLLLMRSVLFRYLREAPPNCRPQDFALRFKLLHALTNSGKDIKCLEEQIGPLLVQWLGETADESAGEVRAQLPALVSLATNVVKFNAVYLEEADVHALVERACRLAAHAPDAPPVLACLALLEAVLSYSLLPRGALPSLVAALCRTVNHEHYCQHSWRLMRHVVGGDVGYAALGELTAAAGSEEAGVARGAVFFLSSALWGGRRVPALQVSPAAVLPALRRTLRLRHAVLAYELLVALHTLVARAHADLHSLAWDLLLDIVQDVVDLDRSFEPPNDLVHSRLHALISSVEELQEAGQFRGDPERLLDLLDLCGHERPEASVVRLISARGAALDGHSATAALALADRYVRKEPRLAVRLHALQTLLAYIRRTRCSAREEIAERVGCALAGLCAGDAECALRAAAARALPDLAALCSPDACIDLVDQLEKILNRPFEMYVSDVSIPADADTSDAAAARAGLAGVLHERLPRAPAAPAARALLVLLDHLDLHYRRPAVYLHHPELRRAILDMLFALRTNSFHWVGFCYDAAGAAVWGPTALRLRPVCSPYLVAEPPAARGAPPREPTQAAAGACAFPAGRAARVLVAAVSREADWRVTAHVLRALPHLLQARALALGRRAQDIDLLASTLCSVVSEAGGGAVSVSELHAAALPALAAMAPYNAFLEPHTQQRVVRCLLKHGMALRAPQPYIAALTLFALEMRETMVRMLPEVLLDLSKISDTAAIASPMLEFLSTLTRLPSAFASFVEDQYMSVFAILLPYTNPSRYNHYVVSLAHHVIAAWFLKCRLSYRRNFVRFIIHGLHNYVIVPFEERLQRGHAPEPANEDSSNRQRSSSLGSRATPRPLAGRAERAAGSSAPAAFHVELTETCVDLLARYTFTPCSVKPHRSEAAEFLLRGGQATTWLVGHKLLTVTTSGCTQVAARRGLCERCATLCRPADASRPPHADPPDDDDADVERQVSSDNRSTDLLADAIEQFTRRLDRISKEAAGPESEGRRAPEGGACGCRCARWAQLHVRSPTGDVAWLLRMQNHVSAPQLHDWPLQDVLALLSPPVADEPQTSRRPRAADLHNSSSEFVVAGDRRQAQPPAPPSQRTLGTQPINIPSSPQRKPADDDDMLLVVPEGKSRHPVRRSNSSPEMSSSWKIGLREPPGPAVVAVDDASEGGGAPDDDMIPLPVCEPTTAATSLASKKAKKSDLRVSCEAIPEESGTSPQPPRPHPHLVTYNSDPGDADVPPHHLQKTSSDSTVPLAADELPPLARSKRSNTISVMSPTDRARYRPGRYVSPSPSDFRPVRFRPLTRTLRREGGAPSGGAATAAAAGSVSPSFVFLQLYHNMSTRPLSPAVPGEAPTPLGAACERPLRVSGAQHERTLKNIDLVPPIETYKVGVLYAGPGQADDEVAILRNEYGSVRYSEFVRGLGALVPLAGAGDGLFLSVEGGGRDGRYTYVWSDDLLQVQYHVATAMPLAPGDPTCNEKRKYVGNDYVSIVYNDSGREFDILTIKGQFNLCVVVVEPAEGGLSRVLVKTKSERIRSKFLAHLTPAVLSDANAAALARQQALHCALASQISQSLERPGAPPYASNCLERLRLIKRLRARVEAERRAQAARAPPPYHASPHSAHAQRRVAIDDFNDYT
ncbi:unnamed protein product [Pieris macdunnoughi]|uniref:Rap-GAP domain-containing protein n=1 Tax=Pieris macdunnoughi TaxID=345717 RepID=A0A821XWY3_9NEOP|nr:unnamed protein product [Pieris macdunnoughi]